ncbi:MAG: hypothetical protein EOO20_16785 [Chryseobacterium sp.]|nr:MAG: hypothetical protein EOO20_16785 [Chryseobacterium sp.]
MALVLPISPKNNIMDTIRNGNSVASRARLKKIAKLKRNVTPVHLLLAAFVFVMFFGALMKSISE